MKEILSYSAENIANAVEADIVRLTPLKELNPEKGSRFFWGGKQVFMKQAPPFEPLAINPEDYQMIFIGTPIWASSITPVIRSFLNRYKLHNKQIAVFWSSAGGKGKAYSMIQELVPDNQFLGKKGFTEPIKRNTEEAIQTATTWALQVCSDSAC